MDVNIQYFNSFKDFICYGYQYSALCIFFFHLISTSDI